jgi:arylsulfatase A-like enzyme
MSQCPTRREFVKTVSAGVATLAAASASKAFARPTSRPNIIYFMADDHAANAFKCYGSRLAEIAPTQKIERLAREGMRLDNCFCTNSICTPSRAAILTGKYSQKNGVYTLGDVLDGSQPNVAKELQTAGYQTAIVGKWHLKSEPTGFDYYCVLPGQGKYHNPMLKEKGNLGSDEFMGNKGREFEGYSSDVIAGQALNWLEKRDAEKPFFLMCHFKAPHGLWEPPKRYENLFDGVEIPEPDSLWEDKSHRSEATRTRGSTVTPKGPHNMVERTTSDKWPTGKLDITGMNDVEQGKAAYQKYLKDYLGCVAAINDNVGRLLDYLDAEGLADNTVVMYTADQGQYLGEHDYYDKRWMYEESLRMPFLVRYPGEIKAGSASDDICLNIDFAATFLDYAGLGTPSDMQGRSFRSNLAGKTPSGWRDSMYYRYWMHLASHDNPAHYGVRTKEFKLIFFYGLPLDAKGGKNEPSQPGWELYDLRTDPKEMNNVYGNPKYAGVTKQLKTELLRLKEELGDTDEKYPELMKVREQYWD